MRTIRPLLSAIMTLALAIHCAAQGAIPAKTSGEQNQPQKKGAVRQAPTRGTRVRVPRSYKDLKFPPLNQIKVPEALRVEMANGLVVYLVEDHELPLINVSAMIRTGPQATEEEGKGRARQYLLNRKPSHTNTFA